MLGILIFGESSGISLIRDAEIETVLTDMVNPIFKVAGLKPNSAKVFVINSDTVNAFTIGNGYIFVNSGLILRFEDPLQMIAVLSHETGHIAAGHIVRLIARLNTLRKTNAVVMLAGVLATVLSGSEKAMATSIGYIMTNERLFLGHSRSEEAAADNLGVTYLEKLGYDPVCMISAFEVFQKDNRLNGDEYVQEYARSHPDFKSRINYLKNRSSKLVNLKKCADVGLIEKYQRIRNKVRAFCKTRNVPQDEYSRSIYLYRKGKIKEAIEILEKLSKDNPKDVFYTESLAYFLYKSGDLKRSISVYKKIDRKDLNSLIRKNYAEVLIEANENIDKAISILESIKYNEVLDKDIYRLLANAYGKKNKLGIADLMLTQDQLLQGNYKAAEVLLTRCLTRLNGKTEQSYIKKAKYLMDLIKRNQD